VVVGAVGFGVCSLLWRVMFGVASMFVSLSKGMAKFGFLALAAAMVTVGGVWLRARFQINPDARRGSSHQALQAAVDPQAVFHHSHLQH
jgi:hypothetical protein